MIHQITLLEVSDQVSAAGRPLRGGNFAEQLRGAWAPTPHLAPRFLAPGTRPEVLIPAYLAVNGLPLPAECSWTNILWWAADRCRGRPRPPGKVTPKGFIQATFCPQAESGTSTLPHAVKLSSNVEKPSPIRRAVSTLVYATLLHPAQGLLPMTIHPP